MDQPQSLLEFALTKIRDNIQSGKYPPGSKLSSKDISEELGISRTPINAAINRLVAEGLAEAIPRRGNIVTQLSAKNINDIADVRTMIEIHAAKAAVKNVEKHPEIISEMESLLEEFENIGDEDFSIATKLESRFHTLLVMLSENDQLIKLFQINWSVGALYHVHRYSKIPLSYQYKSFNEGHRKIVKLLKEKDAEQLCSFVEEHLAVCYDFRK